MVKKKVNPNKIPLSDGKLDVSKISEAATDKATLIAWAEILSALADFPEMCAEKLQQLWMDTNKAAGRVHRQEDVIFWVSEIEEIAGIELSYTVVSRLLNHWAAVCRKGIAVPGRHRKGVPKGGQPGQRNYGWANHFE